MSEPPDRYLYCVVDVGGVETPSFACDGIDGATTGLVESDGLAAVVQPCSGPFDATDPETVRRWLARHQAVVDEATAAFGTPVPFRFDTVFRGGDDAVADWLAGERDRLTGALAEVAGRREYRVEVTFDPDALSRGAREDDADLASLADRVEGADQGRAFLLEKQYERRLADARSARAAERADALASALAEHAARVRRLEESSPSGLVEEGDRPDGPRARFALLASPDAEGVIGAVLDGVADALEIRYTGPWAPYTFVPDLAGGGAEADAEADRAGPG